MKREHMTDGTVSKNKTGTLVYYCIEWDEVILRTEEDRGKSDLTLSLVFPNGKEMYLGTLVYIGDL